MGIESSKMIVRSWLKNENEANFIIFKMRIFISHLGLFYKHKRKYSQKRCFQATRGSNGLNNGCEIRRIVNLVRNVAKSC